MYIDRNNLHLDLDKMSLDELIMLNFKEESYYAKKIRKLPAFSKERAKYSKMAYEKIFQIADYKKLKDPSYKKSKGNGVTDKSIALLKKLILKYKAKYQKINVYEAGVGSGYALDKIKDIKNIEILGCDVFLSKTAKALNKRPNIHLKEEALYDNLKKIPDNYLDIFYADNVLEHIVEDEYEQTLNLIIQKLKKTGIIYAIIPNASIGPSDVSKYFKEEGSKALGFHFMERTYKENMANFKKLNLQSKYLAFLNRNKDIKLIKACKILSYLKIKLEHYLVLIKNKKKRHRMFKFLGYDIYLLKKGKPI